MEKRGQVTIYVIIAVIIVAVIVLVYLFYPRINTIVSGEFNPQSFLQNRLKDPVNTAKITLSQQGGYSAPEGFITYKNNHVKYLCYTSEYYKPCKVQQPLIKDNYEQEMQKLIQKDVETAMQELRAQYERRGYGVSQTGNIKTTVEIIPDKIIVHINSPLVVTKETSQSFDNFEVDYTSKMYFLLMTSTSIIDFESTYGDSETSLYIQYYPNLIIEKNKLDDGSKIYNVEDVTTKESFTFATRSLAWPGGLGLRETK